LMNRYNVSRNTAIQSLEKLVGEGWAYRVKGRGTFATRPSIKNSVNKNIGFLVANGEGGIFPGLTSAIENKVFQQGYHIVLCYTNFDFDKQEQHMGMLIEKKVAGVIFHPLLSNEHFERNLNVVNTFQNNGIPVVVVDMPLPGKDVYSISSDNFKGVYESTKYLLRSGHREIAFISSMLGTSISERIRGYRTSLQESGIKVNEEWIKIPVTSNPKTGYEETFELLAGNDRPTAIVCAHDLIAVNVLQALNEKGISVPDEISVMGFDNLPVSQITHPPLTTIAQNLEAMGEKSVEILMKLIQGKPVSQKRFCLPVNMIKRDSVAKLTDKEVMLKK